MYIISLESLRSARIKIEFSLAQFLIQHTELSIKKLQFSQLFLQLYRNFKIGEELILQRSNAREGSKRTWKNIRVKAEIELEFILYSSSRSKSERLA